jgi:hypothetical protein
VLEFDNDGETEFHHLGEGNHRQPVGSAAMMTSSPVDVDEAIGAGDFYSAVSSSVDSATPFDTAVDTDSGWGADQGSIFIKLGFRPSCFRTNFYP